MPVQLHSSCSEEGANSSGDVFEGPSHAVSSGEGVERKALVSPR